MIDLKTIRTTYSKLKAKHFAEAIGVPYTTYINYEKGREPSLECIVKISKYLNIPIDALINNDVKISGKQQEAVKLVLSLNDDNLVKIIERATMLKEIELNSK